MIVKALICILVPILMLSGLLESKSRRVALSLAAGCCMCLAAYYINSYLYSEIQCSYFYLTTTISPIVEELLKFIPIIIFSLAVTHEQKQLVQSAFAVGIGFAIIENSYMLLQASETAMVSWLILRGIGTGLMHGMSTAIIGFGISIAEKDKRLAIVGTASSVFLAMMYHGVYNCLIQTENIKFTGILLSVLTYIAVFSVLFRIYKDNSEQKTDKYKKGDLLS